jgi:hypothetical protein
LIAHDAFHISGSDALRPHPDHPASANPVSTVTRVD